MEIENVENLAERCAQLIMQQRRKYAGPQADGGLWQSVGNDQFNGFATFAASVAVDDVLRNNRFNAFGDIFDDATAGIASIWT